MEELDCPNEQLWCYSVWKTMVNIQMKKASRLRHKFIDGIKVNICNNLDGLKIRLELKEVFHDA